MTVHGYGGHPLYNVWAGMKRRCNDPETVGYGNYGGRGITICREWSESVKAFIEWCLANGWKRGLTIDRKDNNGPYAPWNCRFITVKKNCNNKRTNTLLTAFGETK